MLFAGYDVAIAVVGIMIGIAGILLGVGYAANNRQLKDLATSELFQSFVNAAIIGVLFLAFSRYGVVTFALNSIVGNLTAGTHCAQSVDVSLAMCFASAYLTDTTAPVYFDNHAVLSLTQDSVSLLIPLGIINSLITAVKLAGPIGVVAGSALLPFKLQVEYAINAVSGALMFIELQGALLKVISAAATPIILPIGLILRTFYATRSLGGTMIAVAIGLFAIFPLTYVLNAKIADTAWNASVSSTMNSTTRAAQILQASISAMVGQPSNSIVSRILGATVSFNSGLLGFVTDVLSYVSLLIIEVLVLPIFSMLLTVIAIAGLARMLSSEFSLSHFNWFRW